MPVYTEPLSKNVLYKRLEENNSKKICIVGCGVCANVSCSLYQGKNQPVMSMSGKPLAMERQINRLRKTLQKDDYTVTSTTTVLGLCKYSDKKEKEIQRLSENTDTVIVMSCPAGIKTIETAVPDKKIVRGMQLKGFKSVEFKWKNFKMYSIDKE